MRDTGSSYIDVCPFEGYEELHEETEVEEETVDYDEMIGLYDDDAYYSRRRYTEDDYWGV